MMLSVPDELELHVSDHPTLCPLT